VYFEGHDDVLGGSDPTMGEIAFFFSKTMSVMIEE